MVRSQKGLTKPKNRTNSTRGFSEQFKGVAGHYPIKRGFRGKLRQTVPRTFGKNFITQFICGTFSVPKVLRAQKHVLLQSTSPFACTLIFRCPQYGHWKKFWKDPGETPKTLSERFLEFRSQEYGWEPPNPKIQCIEASRAFPEFRKRAEYCFESTLSEERTQ